MSDDYEIVSRKELDALKKEVAELKARPIQPPSADLMMALDRLSGHIHHLTKLFEQADKAITQEYHKGQHRDDHKLDLVIAQNEQIAKGLLHVSDVMQKKPETHPHYPLKQQHEDFPQPPPLYERSREQESELRIAQPQARITEPEQPSVNIPAPQQETPAPQTVPDEQPAPMPQKEVAPEMPKPLPPAPDLQDLVSEAPKNVPTELPDMPLPPTDELPRAEDEQMPSLPAPPEYSEEQPKQSRKSLMRSFR